MTTAYQRPANVTDLDHRDLTLPYFVYGTLRPGLGNDKVWIRNDATVLFDGEATVSGWEMVVNGIPYAYPINDHDKKITGALILPSDDFHESQWLRIALDSLEGHPNAYRRVGTWVQTPRGATKAWIYQYPHDVSGRTVLMSGDYAAFVSKRREERDKEITS